MNAFRKYLRSQLAYLQALHAEEDDRFDSAAHVVREAVERALRLGLSRWNDWRYVERIAPASARQDLADRVGVTRQTIIAQEGGAYTPSLALALRIAREFDKAIEDVFHLEE
jgi:putative transcriptional regulator